MICNSNINIFSHFFLVSRDVPKGQRGKHRRVSIKLLTFLCSSFIIFLCGLMGCVASFALLLGMEYHRFPDIHYHTR